MRRTPARMLLVAAALVAGLAWLTQAGAADPTDDEFKALVDQDVKAITRAAESVDKVPAAKKKANEKNAAAGIKSSALVMAAYANARIGGKDPAADARAAAVRDEALKVYKAGAGKDYKAAAEAAKGLASAKPAGKAEKVDFLKDLGELTPKEVMDNFKTTANYGTNVEADVQANAKKKGPAAKPDAAALIAYRVLVMGELNKHITKAENMAQKKEWEEYNAKMMKAAEDLLAAAKKKANPAEMAKAFNVLDSSCTACHDTFK